MFSLSGLSDITIEKSGLLKDSLSGLKTGVQVT